MSDLVQKAFGGSAANLVMRALSVGQADAGELARIRALLDQLEEG